MSAPAARRMRLLRLRTLEHRVAIARLVAADGARAAVTSVCARVTALRDGIGVEARGYAGHDLQGLYELSERLDRARIGLEPALAEARAVRDARDAERQLARLAEERTARHAANAARREVAEQELRAASALPQRRSKRVQRP